MHSINKPRPALTFRQNKHVLGAARGKGAPQKSATINLFHQPDIRLKTTPNIPKNVGKPN